MPEVVPQDTSFFVDFLDDEFHEGLFRLISENKFQTLFQRLSTNLHRINFEYQKTIPSMLFGPSQVSLFSWLTTHIAIDQLSTAEGKHFTSCVEVMVNSNSYCHEPNTLFNSSNSSSLSLLANVPKGLIPLEIYQKAINKGRSIDTDALDNAIRNHNKSLFELMLKATVKCDCSHALTVIINQIVRSSRDEESAFKHRKQQHLDNMLLLKDMAVCLINSQDEIPPKFLTTALRQICTGQNKKHSALVFDICQAYFSKHFLTVHNQFHESLTNIANAHFRTGFYEQHKGNMYFKKMQTLCEQSIYGHQIWLEQRIESDMYYELSQYLTLPDFVSFHSSGFYLAFQNVLEDKQKRIKADGLLLENSKDCVEDDIEAFDPSDKNSVLGKRKFGDYDTSTSFSL